MTIEQEYTVEVTIVERYTVKVRAADTESAAKMATEILCELDAPCSSEYFEGCTGFVAGQVDEVTA